MPLGGIGLVLVAGLLAAPARSGAETITQLQAKAAQIASSVEADQAQLETVGTRYVEEEAAQRSAENAASVANSAAQRDAARVSTDRDALRQSAINAYVSAGVGSTFALYLTHSTTDATSGSTYLNVANGVLLGKISALTNDEHRLQVLQATARQQQATAAAALTALRGDRAAALSDLGQERHTLSSTKGELTQLVAARAAAAALAAERAAAAAAAARAAAAAAAAAVASAPPAVSAGPPAPTAVLSSSGSAFSNSSLAAAFAGIRNCESSDDYSLNTGNGYYGAYQFSASTWEGLGGAGVASQAPPSQQDAAAYRLYQQDGFAAWPECAAILGL